MILVKPSFEILASSFPTINKELPYNYHDGWKKLIEVCGRTCYKSEDRITDNSADGFFNRLYKIGHYSVLEHSWRAAVIKGEVKGSNFLHIEKIGNDLTLLIGNYRAFEESNPGSWINSLQWKGYIPPEYHSITVRVICDRGVTHEIVRHRPASYSQESTRYVNYKGGCTFVIPPWVDFELGEYDSLEVLSQFNSSLYSNDSWLILMARAEICYRHLLKEGWSPQQARSVLPNSTKTEIVITANVREWRHIFTLRCSKAAHPQMREVMIPLHKKCKEIIPVIFDDITY